MRNRGRCPYSPLYTQESPAKSLGLDCPSGHRSLLPQIPGSWVQRTAWLGLAPPLEAKHGSHPNCTLESKRGETINEEKLDRKKQKQKDKKRALERESARESERDDIKLLAEAGPRGRIPPPPLPFPTPMHFESCPSNPPREKCPRQTYTGRAAAQSCERTQQGPSTPPRLAPTLVPLWHRTPVLLLSATCAR